MRPKRLISLLVAVCMMITMLPLSAVTAFATDTSTVHEANDDEGIYRYAYKKNEDGETVTITKFLGPVDPTNNGPYVITIPTTLDKYTVTGIGKWAFDRCGLHTLTIEGPIESMGLAAFYECTKLETISFGENIKTIGEQAFQGCSSLTKVTIPDSVTSIGEEAFYECTKLETISFGENIKTIGEQAFQGCSSLTKVTIPDSVTSIGEEAFYECTKLETISFGENIETIGRWAFTGCSALTNVTIPEKVTTIEPDTFFYCTHLKYITLPAGLTSFKESLQTCAAGQIDEDFKRDENGYPILNPDGTYIPIYIPNGAIYYNSNKTDADQLLANSTNTYLKYRNFLCLCHVTFDANGGVLNDSAEVPVYETEKIIGTKANKLTAINDPTRPGYKFTGWYTTADGKPEDSKFDVDKTEITKDITLYAGWKFDPNAPVCRPLTVTGGTVTVKYDGSDVTSKLNSNTDATTGQKTYSVPDGATVTVTLDKTLIPEGMVFDIWSTGKFSLPLGQDYKAETITFTMNTMSSDADIAAQYRDATADHTPATAVCHPLTVTGGIVTVKKGDKDVTDTLTVTTDETTGKKTYSVPDGATVTVTLDKTLIPEGMVFDIWSTGKFSLPLGQDYKAESITFTMNSMSSDADIAAQYRDATIEDDGPNVLGTAAIIGTAAVGTAVLGYQAYSLGAEFAGKLMALPYFPSNRSALAMMLWEDAGKPMPESELLYPDVGQEERDMDLQHAARWAMENELIPDLNDEGTAPEEMKFFPANPVSKLDVLNAWQKAQELKNN